MSGGATARNLVAPLLRWGYRVRLQGAHRCPRRGPLLVVAPHSGFLDPTIVATCLPRPVDVLVDPGGLSALGARIPGRIVVDPPDPGVALGQARESLARGGAVGAWSGDGLERAAGYLALRSAATVLPVVVFGGSGSHPGDPPSLRSPIDVVIGEPFSLDERSQSHGGDPLARSEILRAAELIRQRVADHATDAGIRTARSDGVALDPRGPAPENGAS
jgi:1-acyl-sn-glycerol-3-phosphate acyltransferase